jgi:hypothetical protein
MPDPTVLTTEQGLPDCHQRHEAEVEEPLARLAGDRTLRHLSFGGGRWLLRAKSAL